MTPHAATRAPLIDRRRLLLGATALGALALTACSESEAAGLPEAAGTVDEAELFADLPIEDVVEGDPDAPVTIVEYDLHDVPALPHLPRRHLSGDQGALCRDGQGEVHPARVPVRSALGGRLHARALRAERQARGDDRRHVRDPGLVGPRRERPGGALRRGPPCRHRGGRVQGLPHRPGADGEGLSPPSSADRRWASSPRRPSSSATSAMRAP